MTRYSDRPKRNGSDRLEHYGAIRPHLKQPNTMPQDAPGSRIVRHPPAPAIRRSNLTHVLTSAATSGVDDLWIGLELGHKGGRRTGLAMTDDMQLTAHGQRYGVADRLRRATLAGPVKEMTSSIVWEALDGIGRQVFLWNVVPVHPHRPHEELSNRRHTARERELCSAQLEALVGIVRPQRLVAVGAHASLALTRWGYDHALVRHPAFGGKQDFLAQVRRLACGPVCAAPCSIPEQARAGASADAPWARPSCRLSHAGSHPDLSECWHAIPDSSSNS